MKPKIYILDESEKEVHMFGNSVGVCWNLEEDEKHLKGKDGIVYKAKVKIRSGDPYIDFVNIRERDGEFYEDEDSSVAGGISIEFAKKILGELQLALEYIESLGK